ncbi:MAG TPA: hypothetical protein VFQ54_09165, partial [Thermomicrobiales bacterium]|nr:hypothetical protein [Thermomicrobiales bacterium]
MPQATDIVLDGAGYMIVPATGANATYTRAQDGMAEGRTARIQIRDFFGGQHRAFQLERDRGGDSLAIGPALGGQGVVPWPLTATATIASGVDLPTTATPFPAATIGNHVFFARGRYLYRTVALDATTWAPETQVWDAGAGQAITDVASYNGDILIALGTSEDIQVLPYPGGGVSSTLLAGEQAQHVLGYGGFAIYSRADAGSPVGASNQIRMVTGSGIDIRYLDADVLKLTTVGGEAFAATKIALYSFAGKVQETRVTVIVDPGPPPVTEQRDVLLWNGDWDAYFQHGNWTEDDDYRVVVGYGGRLYVWLNKTVLEHNPSGDRAGWRDTGLGGLRCLGGCVVGGNLVIALETADHRSEVWAWNGAGWWRIASRPAASGIWCWPVALSGAGNWDLMLFTEGSTTIDLVRMIWRAADKHTLPSAAQYVTSMLDAGERDKNKAWRKIGAVFASPDVPPVTTSTDPVTVALDYSVDAGVTWVQAATESLAGSSLANANITLDAELALDGPVSRWLQLRVRWSSVVDWAPVLAGVWAEFEVLDSPARRRRWQMTVIARDQTVDRSGSPLARTGRELIS